MELGDKLAKTTGVLSRLKNFVPSNILLTIYNSLFQSHISYAVTSWGFNGCSRLIKLQKRALRAVTKSKYNAHCDPLFKHLELLKLNDIFNISCMKIYYKFHNNMLPGHFHDFPFKENDYADEFQRPHRDIRPPIRLRNDIAEIPILNPIIPIIKARTENANKCIRFHIPKLVNELYLPNPAREKIYTHSLTGFKNYSKKIIIDQYKEYCTIHNCYICNRQT